MSRYITYVLFTLVLLLAVLARTSNLLDESLWLDEGFSYYAITQPDLTSVLAADVHPPLYFLVLRGWVMLAGDSILAMRYLSVLFGVLGVALIIPLAREFSQRQSALILIFAALLLAISDADIYLSREVRMYTLRTLLVILSVLGYLRWLRTQQRMWGVTWLLSTTALLYTHYLGAYIPLIEGLHALIFLRNRVRLQAIGTLMLSGVLFLPWLGVTLYQAAEPSSLVVPFPSTWETLLDFRNKFFTGQWALLLALALFGGFLLARAKRIGHVVLLALWVIVPVVITFAGNNFLPVLTDRNVMLITPAIALLVAWGLANINGNGRIIITAAIVFYGVTTVDFARIKPRWDRVTEHVTEYAEPGEVVLMEVGADDFPLTYYLDHGLPQPVELRSLRMWRDESGEDYSGELAALLQKKWAVWLVHWSADTNILSQLTDNGYARTATFTTDHLGNTLAVYRYDALSSEGAEIYTNGMILRQAAIRSDRLDLWWSADAPLYKDYTVSTFVLDSNGLLVAQNDSYPFLDKRPTSSWQPGEIVYDPHELPLADLPAGRYTVGVKIYTWQDGQVYETSAGDEWAVVGEIEKSNNGN
jgi:hypothetical protein